MAHPVTLQDLKSYQQYVLNLLQVTLAHLQNCIAVLEEHYCAPIDEDIL